MQSKAAEARMKHEWRKRRVLIKQADAQRRWDRAYEMLLMWAAAAEPCKADHQPILQPFEEDNDEPDKPDERER